MTSILFFLLFFLTAVAVLILFLYLYAKVTPYDDYVLIFEENNVAAALGFGGAIVGLSIPLYSALVSSVSYFDFFIWSLVAMLVQLLFAYGATKKKGKFSFEQKIQDGNVSAGMLMSFLSISIGLLNAGSMSY